MSSPLIKINFDRTEEIAELYGIGSLLAERIVRWRESNGCFTGPDDLTRVDGISASLAITLSPHINWMAPENPSLETHGEDAIQIIMFRFVIITTIYQNLSEFNINLKSLHSSNPEEWISTWMASSFALLLGFSTLSIVLVFLASLTKGEPTRPYLVLSPGTL